MQFPKLLLTLFKNQVLQHIDLQSTNFCQTEVRDICMVKLTLKGMMGPCDVKISVAKESKAYSVEDSDRGSVIFKQHSCHLNLEGG